MAERVIVVQPHSELIGQGCPTCNRGIEVDQRVVDCPRCHTIHHEDCWYNKGGCGKVGCSGRATRRDPDQAPNAPASVKPVSSDANQLPMSVILGIIAVLVLIIVYFMFFRN
ncbi:MAG TPA: hypothetical protein GXZ82_10490 [Firmicutes bacterium]|nr:hypothetical protein [Bacillota bacterium]